MFGSDKTQLVPQLLQHKKNKKKHPKPVYRDLLDTEKNLLLNFQFTENHDYHEHYSDIRPLKTKQLSFYDKKILKQNYLQGNFRFFVNPNYEENITFVDPDQEIKWKTVERVKYITNNLISCPICLNEQYDMIFPKMTRCGHIFCWPCILKYLSYKKSKCPLCDDFLIDEDLRTVQIVYHIVTQPGEKIHLKLKKRRKTENTVYNGEDLVEEEDFIRIKKLGWDDILKLREEETRSLVDYLSILEIEGDKDIKPYVEQCMGHLGSDMEKIQKASAQARQRRTWADEEDVKEEEVANEEEFLYFYQEMNGLNIFLHPINNKYVKLQYNDVKELPAVIEAPLVESKGFQQSELTQRRYKFLNHIPLNSDISFAEVDMKDVLIRKKLDEFNDEMKNYKESNAAKKDLATKPISSHGTNQLPPKPVTIPTEGKYKIEFPSSLPGLKLNDKQDYPELSAAASVQVSSQVKNAWQELVPSKKKGQAAKKNNSQQVKGEIKRDAIVEKNEEKIEDQALKVEANSNNDPDNEWKSVKPDKSDRFFTGGKRK